MSFKQNLTIMYNIQTNASGTRSMEISEVNLQTIQKYKLKDLGLELCAKQGIEII